MNTETQPTVDGRVERKPRAWAKSTAGGDYLRSAPAMADIPEADDGVMRSGWVPLYDQVAMDEAISAERERCRELEHENGRLREAVRILDGFVGRVPSRVEWDVICSLASRVRDELAAQRRQ